MNKRPQETDYAELAVAVYVEELAVDKRVLFVGEPASAAPERLAQVARSVDVVSPRARARGTRRGGRTRARRWPSSEDAGQWDLVLVPDLGGADLADEAKLSEARRWLDDDGVLVAGTSSDGDDSLGYERFFDLLQGSFDTVRMVGQAPFAGYSVVDFAPAGELEVTFDGSLLEDRGAQAQRYLALCAGRDVALDPYAVVQVPALDVAAAPPPAERPQAREDDDRAAEAEKKVAQLTDRLREQQDALDAANVHAEEIERELEQSQRDLEDARGKVRSVEERGRDARESEKALARRVEELEGRSSGATRAAPPTRSTRGSRRRCSSAAAS